MVRGRVRYATSTQTLSEYRQMIAARRLRRIITGRERHGSRPEYFQVEPVNGLFGKQNLGKNIVISLLYL